MSHRKVFYNFLTLGTLLCGVLFLLLADIGKQKTLIVNELLNLGHLPLFGVSSLVLLWILNGRKWPVYEKKYYIISFFSAIILGIASEFFQSLTPDRDLETLDMIRDASGSFIFLILAYPSGYVFGRKIIKLKIFSLFLVLLAITPVFFALFETWRIHQDFPLIDSFEECWESGRWEMNTVDYTFSHMHATQGSKSLKVVFNQGTYPGIGLLRLYGDWRGYTSFTFDAFLEGNKPLEINVRINDVWHNHQYYDRYNKSFSLAPGSNHIAVDLEEVRRSPHTRPMYMKKITNITIFCDGLTERKTVYFDNLKLEKENKTSN